MELKVLSTVISLCVTDVVTSLRIPHATGVLEGCGARLTFAQRLIESRKLPGQRRLVCTELAQHKLLWCSKRLQTCAPIPNSGALSTSPRSNPLFTH